MSHNLPEKYRQPFEEILDGKSKEFLNDYLNGLPEYPAPRFGILRGSKTAHSLNVIRYTLEDTEFGLTGTSIYDLSALTGISRPSLHGGFTLADDEERVRIASEERSARTQRLLDSGSFAGRLLVAVEAVDLDCEISSVPAVIQSRWPDHPIRVFYPINPGDSDGIRSQEPVSPEAVDFTAPTIASPGLVT